MMSKKNKTGKEYWRSLEQLTETPQFEEFLHREFPKGASEMNNAWSRRNFLTLMGASMALAGLAGCRRPVQKIVPYVQPPEEVIPGVPQFYATTMTLGLSAYGIVVESHEGRPTKVEGNTLHPSTRGTVNSWLQSSMLGLYDPDRSQRVVQKGIEKTWDDFVVYWRQLFDSYKATGGEGLAVLSESFASPTLAKLKGEFEKTFPGAKWIAYEPVSDENIYDGVKLAFGKDYYPVYSYEKAEVILSLDADFNLTESENISAARGFASGRNINTEDDSLNRLYVVETAFSTTGAVADHRLALPSREIGRFVLALAVELGVEAVRGQSVELPEKTRRWIKPLTEDLIGARGKGLIVAGRRQPPEVHTLVCAINRYLGNEGVTVGYHEFVDAMPSSLKGLYQLTGEMNDGKVSALIIIGGNPAYNAPVDLGFSRALKKVAKSVHISLYNDETSQFCEWHIPQAHYLESWGDARSVDGTLSVVQPLIEPLFGGRMQVELVNLLATGANTAAYDIVRATWGAYLPKLGFEPAWRKVLHDGVREKSASAATNPGLRSAEIASAMGVLAVDTESGFEVVFRISPAVHDGRFANNGWLQELPDAVTKISWDNVAQVSPKTAADLGFKNEDLIRIKHGGHEIEMPLWIVPGQADNTFILDLGYGRKGLGRIAENTGHNAYTLRQSNGMHFVSGASITGTGRTYLLANVQDHGSMEGRPIVREATLEEYRHHPDFAPHAVHHPPLVSMWNDHKYDEGYQWGMAIDLTTCTGCNACTIACQSENNIPIVGKDQVRRGREMHWIRVDRYFKGDTEEPQMVHQPVACQHCEMAPCEQVCPVAATVHDDEGLNTMVYNRCIGTRYCSNNCPYKVRRFNFHNFTKDMPEIVKMAMNPDVTVRSRGVMEKCTFCVQRINRVKIEAKKQDRLIRDGEIVTACQQACPTGAIVFGNINDPESAVVKVKKRNRNYNLLDELNVRPRTSYLAKIRNPNPKLTTA